MFVLNSRREFKNEIFMAMAFTLSGLSTCVRRKVGCILVDTRDRIIATGYNGVPSGMRHCTDKPCPGAGGKSGEDLDLCISIHAEQNALIMCERPFELRKCYVTTSPCVHCMKMLLNTSCQEIYYRDKYSHTEAEDLWLSAKRQWYRI